ncbi:hypothetical protein NIES2119_31315 [[Phormidium ambiguum] IAM M-71]|uniref:Uncharacterized protein n=1 Tax=[Phormidium ambiguum] IAM M-71 TaxID=454136 RepID=A0A1U7I2B9_9CYAN|nr:hypothetical protein [Phormidium ambiguum]OKH30224.1 hypothetical protein NIES2119_31315 [Phormidium ambiguum IAM M-71]
MQQRRLGILQRFVSGKADSGRKLLRFLRKVISVLFKFFYWFVPIVIGLLLLWIVGGHLLASQMEKPVEQAWERFSRQFPKTETNTSAMKVEELAANLGLNFVFESSTTPTRKIHIPASKTKVWKEFDGIRKELNTYLDVQLAKPNDEIDPPPEKLRNYLVTHATDLELLSTYVLNSEPPHWGFDITLWDLAYPLPAFLSTADFQKILALDMLEKTRQGKTQEALKILDVSWRLNQVLLARPSFIAQLVSTIVLRYQLIAMRKMQGVPAAWTEQIERFVYKARQAFSTSLEAESFMIFLTLNKYSISKIFFDKELAEELGFETSFTIPRWLGWAIDPVLKPWFRIFTVDYFEQMQRSIHEFIQPDFCSANFTTFEKQYKFKSHWWNSILINLFLKNSASFEVLTEDLFPPDQWNKLNRRILQLELTQKVLQAKSIAAQQGSFPQKIPGIETSICRDAKWRYKVAKDGTMSLSFDKQKDLDWLKPQSPGDLLTYYAKWKLPRSIATNTLSSHSR